MRSPFVAIPGLFALTIACSNTAPSTTAGAGGEAADAKTQVPDTKVPETKVPETKVPETKVPDTKVPDTKAAVRTKTPDPSWPKRPPPKPLVADARKIDYAKFHTIAHPRHPEHGWMHALEDGGCGVYLSDGTQRPPGSFPAPLEVECPPEMLAPEWGHCTGPGTMQRSDDAKECICSPGVGDPPASAFRVPCPPVPATAVK